MSIEDFDDVEVITLFGEDGKRERGGGRGCPIS